jgi:hypothetical protein
LLKAATLAVGVCTHVPGIRKVDHEGVTPLCQYDLRHLPLTN